MLTAAVARFFGGNAVCYLLPDLWMTIFSLDGANGAESKTTLCFVEFARWRHWGQRLAVVCCL